MSVYKDINCSRGIIMRLDCIIILIIMGLVGEFIYNINKNNQWELFLSFSYFM